MSTEENKATFLHAVDELNSGNLDFIDEVFSPHFTLYTPLYPDWPRGLAGARKMVTQLCSVLSDMQATVEDIFAEGDKVAVRWTFRGVYRGEARPDFPAPGERIVIAAISMYRFVDGKVVDDWGVDSLWRTGKVWKNIA